MLKTISLWSAPYIGINFGPEIGDILFWSTVLFNFIM